MPSQLRPETRDDFFADVDRRLRALEATARVGLSGVRAAWSVISSVPTSTFSPSFVTPTWDTGPVGATWADDQGGSGTGYPKITIQNMPSRAWVVWEARMVDIGLVPGGTFRSRAALVTLGVNGVFNSPLPRSMRQVNNNDNGNDRYPVIGTAIRTFTPGSTAVFQFAVAWEDNAPANLTFPSVSDCQLVVLPLSSG